MGKPINNTPLIHPAWSMHFQKVSQQVRNLCDQHQPKNPQCFRNRVWANYLQKLISGVAK